LPAPALFRFFLFKIILFDEMAPAVICHAYYITGYIRHVVPGGPYFSGKASESGFFVLAGQTSTTDI